eukprot:3717021-Pleurochrysis_carterae.AAC.1
MRTGIDLRVGFATGMWSSPRRIEGEKASRDTGRVRGTRAECCIHEQTQGSAHKADGGNASWIIARASTAWIACEKTAGGKRQAHECKWGTTGKRRYGREASLRAVGSKHADGSGRKNETLVVRYAKLGAWRATESARKRTCRVSRAPVVPRA